ncbi:MULTISPECIES: lytic murein transglycosylase [unclassified Mesorhizobium]|uniref:lytic murein transglycosylase n=1 Tax=unclassified Mesorhizobium TaxID=325217 RepID=UPI000FCADE1F|nr:MULTISPECIES: lytic murein transglycosylase [unclassified Mesorhizobium]TIT66510.1 MAG: lytic murein transglycosylase [Mesorhizobium sp.]RUW48341.1 lytic murein transglycosylase [Mesorhizobium sp. M8A.F.Ca.ET.021.01.1.1]TGQ94153.1 lytic murein transglycosylase [Mesorhizobium sp. M8A.F.Ca.ET.208.01.1.1]TGS48260.1 lytic murein transglycosylase [Mesorhizobium sp. M8A.F.Ca.ET.182.01.1.1]TGS83450.1 lytic murein transglycosylase [Mesorhizobium sp. M8A.F.Ca.ET.181.01.1.1]
MRLRSQALAALFLCATALPAMAQECGGDFETWKQGVAAEAKAAGVGAVGLDALEDARIDEKALARDRAQGVFTQTFVQFSNRMISAYRLKQGAANMKKYADIFARADQQFGVQAPVITAFWALETDFGAVQGDFHTLSALVTLSHDCRRPQLFRQQLVPLLELIDRGVLPADVTGAWAGEIGQTQILPSDYLARGVDGDGDGKIDLRNSVPDVIMTTGNKVLSRGWKRDEPWIQEVRVPDEMPWDQTGRTNKLPLTQWAQWGVTNPDGSPLVDKGLQAGLALPMGRKGPAFLTYENFDVYLEWNQSFTYALTAANLAARLAGAPPLDPRNPEPGLNNDQMKALQTKLEASGYDVGTVDGILGTNTREAIRKEQMRLGLPVDGWPTPELLGKL